MVDALEDRLGFKAPKDVDKSVTNETINAAAEMFIYLTYCRKDSQAAWAQLYRNLFQNHNPDMILITLNRLMKTSQHDVAKELFEYLEIQWNLKFQSFATGGPNRMNIAIILRLINIYLSIVMQYPNPKRSIFCAVDIQSILLEKITNYPHLLLFLSANLVEICQQWQLR